MRSNLAKVFIFWGQSNMVAAQADLTNPPPESQRLNPRILIWNVVTQKIETYTITVNSNTVSGPQPSPHWGPEARFIYRHSIDHPEDFVYVLKYGIGSTLLAASGGLTNWLPSENESFRLVIQASDVLKAKLFLMGLNPVVQAIIGHQGEADASAAEFADLYQINKAQFYLRAANWWAGENADVKFIDGRIKLSPNPDLTPFGDTVRAAQLAAAQARGANTYLIDADDLTLDATDQIHFDGPSLVELGNRFYDAYAGNTNVHIIYP